MARCAPTPSILRMTQPRAIRSRQLRSLRIRSLKRRCRCLRQARGTRLQPPAKTPGALASRATMPEALVLLESRRRPRQLARVQALQRCQVRRRVVLRARPLPALQRAARRHGRRHPHLARRARRRREVLRSRWEVLRVARMRSDLRISLRVRALQQPSVKARARASASGAFAWGPNRTARRRSRLVQSCALRGSRAPSFPFRSRLPRAGMRPRVSQPRHTAAQNPGVHDVPLNWRNSGTAPAQRRDGSCTIRAARETARSHAGFR